MAVKIAQKRNHCEVPHFVPDFGYNLAIFRCFVTLWLMGFATETSGSI